MLKFRWLGRILVCLLMGLVFGAIMLGLGPPIPKAPNHLGLDAIHKHYYNQVWELSDMPEGATMYDAEPGDGDLEGLPAQPYSSQLKAWWWVMNSRWKSQKFKMTRWMAKKKREMKSKK